MLHGERVILRPARQEDLSFLEEASRSDCEDEFNDFGVYAEGQISRRFEENGLFGNGNGLLIVTDYGGQFLGHVSFHQVRYGPGDTSIAYNIGISLIPMQRGKGYGVEAQRLLAAYLFTTYTIMRVEASTDVENTREQRALEKAGFMREGVLRGAQWRNGAYHDMVSYSKLRGE
jgi:RimJ/RimL family protein N-acetyltransferase